MSFNILCTLRKIFVALEFTIDDIYIRLATQRCKNCEGSQPFSASGIFFLIISLILNIVRTKVMISPDRDWGKTLAPYKLHRTNANVIFMTLIVTLELRQVLDNHWAGNDYWIFLRQMSIPQGRYVHNFSCSFQMKSDFWSCVQVTSILVGGTLKIANSYGYLRWILPVELNWQCLTIQGGVAGGVLTKVQRENNTIARWRAEKKGPEYITYDSLKCCWATNDW